MRISGSSLKAVSFSVLVHVAAFSLLVISFDIGTRTFKQPAAKIVNAVAIDNKAVEKEIQKLKEIDEQKQKKQQEVEQKLKAAEKKLADAENKRRTEEKRLADARKKKEQETKQREQEAAKLAQIKKQQEDLEKQKKIEEQQQRKAEEERQRIAAEQKKREEEEQERKQREEALKKQLAEEQKAREAEQARKDQQLLRNIYAELKRRVINNFNISGLPPGLKCEISVRVIPGGEVLDVSITKSSGNDIFDSRAKLAVQKASPLPVPADAATLDRLNLRHFIFEFSPGE